VDTHHQRRAITSVGQQEGTGADKGTVERKDLWGSSAKKKDPPNWEAVSVWKKSVTLRETAGTTELTKKKKRGKLYLTKMNVWACWLGCSSETKGNGRWNNVQTERRVWWGPNPHHVEHGPGT